MIRLSPGIISASRHLFGILGRHSVSKRELPKKLKTIMGTKTEDVIDTAVSCNWITSETDMLKLSPRAIYLSQLGAIELEREMLRDFIISNRPSWASLLTKGRLESIPFMPIDIQACFYDAHLMEQPPGSLTIEWWDTVLGEIYSEREENHIITGRIGERLSIEFEKNRTGQTPIWKSIDSNLAGYDLLSQASNYDLSKLLIEVKASKSDYEHAVAHITRNEWDTACLAANYCFHLWLISNSPQIAIISYENMKKHIPFDNGEGNWESVAIQFRSFDIKLWHRMTKM